MGGGRECEEGSGGELDQGDEASDFIGERGVTGWGRRGMEGGGEDALSEEWAGGGEVGMGGEGFGEEGE